MEKYIMTEKEFNALDKVMELGRLDYIAIVQDDDLGDCFEDFEEGGILTLEEGLQIIYESSVVDICFENKDITKREFNTLNKLFEKFNIQEE